MLFMIAKTKMQQGKTHITKNRRWQAKTVILQQKFTAEL